MSDLMARLFEESQDNPDCLYWQAADRIRELEAEVARLRAGSRLFPGCMMPDGGDACPEYCAAVNRAEAAEAKLRAVGELPGRWKKEAVTPVETDEGYCINGAYQVCAHELEALLKDGAL